MSTLPFPLAQPARRRGPVHGTALLRHAEGDACCAPLPAIPAPPARPQRATLAALDLHLPCSIVGTCLTTGELRKLVPRFAPHIDRKGATDLEIHHAAVALCCEVGPGRKEIIKALDARHALAIRKFKAAGDEDALRALWRGAMASGDIPGAYWALMTQPALGPDVRALAFGDVHMLSHLVGASNRADIRRLVALEEECQALREQNERQQGRLQDMGARHQPPDALLARLVAAAGGELLRTLFGAGRAAGGAALGVLRAARMTAGARTMKTALRFFKRPSIMRPHANDQ
jgi:hypothetical protein